MGCDASPKGRYLPSLSRSVGLSRRCWPCQKTLNQKTSSDTWLRAVRSRSPAREESRARVARPDERTDMNDGLQILYTAEATAVGGREGHARTSDGRVDVALDVPREMGGPGGPGTNPEQLFATGYAACFQSALLRIAAGRKLHVSGSPRPAAGA